MRLIKSVGLFMRKLDRYSPFHILYSFKMTTREKKLFKTYIRQATRYFEFGMGGSTLFALQKSKVDVYSVDSSLDWINYMRKYVIVKLAERKRRLRLYFVDIGPTKEWGYPVENKFKDRFPFYSSTIIDVARNKNIDLVLIDGRFRVASTIKTIQMAIINDNNVKILIHDFWNRVEYQVLNKYLNIIDRVDTLGVFTVKKNIGLNALNDDYENYKYDAR